MSSQLSRNKLQLDRLDNCSSSGEASASTVMGFRLPQVGRKALSEAPSMWRHPLEVQTGSGDVLAEVARRDLEAGIKKGRQELGWDQMKLPELGQAATDKVAVPNERAGVGVAFDAVAFHQDYAVKGRFAEVVPTMLSERNVPR